MDAPGKQFYVIQGISIPEPPDPVHPIPIRPEVGEWYDSRDQNPTIAIQVSLYLQALLKFQRQSWTEQLSYFQIAGIHGFPAQVWDDTGETGFYCAHQLPTFPTWHRAYLTLYEQVLHSHMIEIINAPDFPAEKKLEWTEAANRWRLPYWDYASKPSIPNIAVPENIDVINPSGGKPITLDPNPMYRYQLYDPQSENTVMGDKARLGKFAIEDNIDPKGGNPSLPWSRCKGTSRYGNPTTTADWVKGTSDGTKVTRALQSHHWPEDRTTRKPKATGTIKENVYKLFTPNYFSSWSKFASTKYYARGTANREWLSLESIHNMIHNWTGGGDVNGGLGHMCDVPVAAFDPIFWLHHCFIDRCAAIWQELNPKDTWFNDPLPADPDKVDPDNPDLWKADPKPTDPLNPFHKESTGRNASYTSDDVKNWRKLGYDYKILEARAEDYKADGTLNRHRYVAHVRKDINKLYSTTRSEVLDAMHTGGEALKETLGKNQTDYVINVLYNRYGLNGGDPYVLHFYVGPVDVTGEYTYATHPNRVGSVYTFSSRFETASGRVKCSNCESQIANKVLSTAQIPITGALIADVIDSGGLLTDVAPEIMGLYLKNELTWKAFRVRKIR
ncbi:hypothetical protein ACMFMG_011286 [Clarireedia jacksonii]